MKKLIMIMSMIPLIATAVALQFMTGKIPVHFDASGDVDRWGSRYESLLLPITIMAMGLMIVLLMRHYEKKAASDPDDKERAGAISNRKALGITGLGLIIVLTVIQAVMICLACNNADFESDTTSDVFRKVTCVMVGGLMIVIGNILPKTRKNSFIGMRTPWTLSSDTVWNKSNRFSGYAMVIAGLIIVIGTALIKGTTVAFALLMVTLTVAIIVSLIYSYAVYKKEIGEEH